MKDDENRTVSQVYSCQFQPFRGWCHWWEPIPCALLLHYPSFNPNFCSSSPWIERDGEGYTANIFWATWHQFKDNVLCWLFKIDLPLPRTIALLLPNWYLCCALPLCTHAISELIRELQTLVCFSRSQGIVQLQSGAGSENGQACTPPSCGMSDTNPGHH